MQAPALERNAELLAAYGRNPSAANRNAVVHANLPLVWRLAREESRRSGHSFDDLVQVGCIGLIKAVERFEAQRGSTLSTAAYPWIRGAMRTYATPLSNATGALVASVESVAHCDLADFRGSRP